MKLSELLCNNFDDGGRPIIEDGECVVSAFVKVIVSPTGMPYVQQPQPTQPQPTDSSNTNNPNPGNNNNTVNSGNNNPKLNPSIKEKKSIP
ncbi:hypothetical protein AX774_g5051 [Zancudomyces culisetae]|uniref:Uncharacterized protein n=2 Tax=Zancudomyces culisetae TaxID=1213189 RepID=A0A1R1PKJ6_ZANCU|nr:hypothetical protein AX774_g5051 [Zancudomyces culisetae]|eukprot:OMH81498.1 hypothetical protein AX774_g5051 [Zancudomyces culisetae]